MYPYRGTTVLPDPVLSKAGCMLETAMAGEIVLLASRPASFTGRAAGGSIPGPLRTGVWNGAIGDSPLVGGGRDGLDHSRE